VSKRRKRFQEAMERPYEALKGPSKYPALLLTSFGKGSVAYFPEAMGAFFCRLRDVDGQRPESRGRLNG